MEILDKANYVVKMWASPCALPWFVYAELALPAAAHTVIDYLGLGTLETIRELGKASYAGEFTPAGRFGKEGMGKRFLGGASHGRHRRGRRGIPHDPDFMGGEIEKKEGKIAKATKFLWRGLAPLERGLFWWFIAEEAADFAYNFTSLVYQCEECSGDHKEYPLQLSSDGYQGALAIVPYNYVSMETVDQNNSYLSHEHSTVNLPQGTWHIVVACSFWAPDADAIGWCLGIYANIGLGDIRHNSTFIDLLKGEEGRITLDLDLTVTPIFSATLYPYVHCRGHGNVVLKNAYMIITPDQSAPCSNGIIHF